MAKLRVGILFGGRSTEHEVSVNSATSIAKKMDTAQYAPVLIGIDHDGCWHIAEPEHQLLPQAIFSSPQLARSGASLRQGLELLERNPVDVVFPIIHGRDGEDGNLQGLLELARIPYVGAGVTSTALCMDKAMTKRVLRDEGIPVLPCHEAPRASLLRDASELIREVENEFGYPVFVKPCNTGSSVGVSKAKDRESLSKAIQQAARYDLHVLVEPGLDAREIECAVLGGHDPEASPPGEILPANEFYDYEAKYVCDDTKLVVPAELSKTVSEEIRTLAVQAFSTLKCWGMARVDFFLRRADEKIFLNELNTHPGFTEVSLYPRMWQAAGVSMTDLIDRLIGLALERHREQSQLEVRFKS